MEFQRLPVCIFSFNRPDYLRATLEALRVALDAGGMIGPVALFQDGAWNPHSRQTMATPQAIAACIAQFQRLLPHGQVIESSVNLGIAENIARGEAWAFEGARYPAALFFEDDMVVAPGYFRAMAGLYALAQAQPRIAMFAAYGADGRASAAEQFAARRHAGPMHHNWAFGLTRTAWVQREALTRDYMDILSGHDYRDRPLDRIAAWYGRMGWPPLPTTQDIAKSAALNTLGLARIASVAACARYIGATGTHYNPDEFARLGFADVVLIEDTHPDLDWQFDVLDDAAIDAIVARQRADMLAVRLGADSFIGSTALIEALRVIRHLGPDALLPPQAAAPLTSAAGFYPDCWSHPHSSLVLSAAADLREVALEAIAAQHLPSGTRLDLLLNGQPAGSVQLDPGETFSVTLLLPRSLDGLEKVITARCSVNTDPFTAGFNADRRPLGFLLLRLTLLARDGGRTVLEGRDVIGSA